MTDPKTYFEQAARSAADALDVAQHNLDNFTPDSKFYRRTLARRVREATEFAHVAYMNLRMFRQGTEASK